MTKTGWVTAATMLVMSTLIGAQTTAAGRWVGQEKTGRGTAEVVLQLGIEGSTVTGSVTIGERPSQALSDGKISGKVLTFKTTLVLNGKEVAVSWEGEVTDSRLTLVRTFGAGGPTLAPLVLERPTPVA